MYASKIDVRRDIESLGHQLGVFAADEIGLPAAACDHCKGMVVLYGDGSYVKDDILYEECRERPRYSIPKEGQHG